MATLALSPQAANDVRKLKESRRSIERLLGTLAEEPRPANVDVKPLRGRAPWERARIGDYRVLFRRLAPSEMRRLGRTGRGYYVARIVHRRDLDRAIAVL